ncbi:hypothetical protein HELRODRAFT_112954 [Helobdella robusta]|uniref:V-type proton ATPase subunit a n=1 Tax=Helobdella robusta TaxID=6412 RepID=T1EFN5_HELRO|nr:hypothetical protein HELRODRAFT_112954 [Helobdella robusta]ESO00811.1 hypothetical protein HELRODRAFT_112954 [Helobdella robusta]
MGSLYRSEEMTLCQLFLQAEAAYACVSELGELGLVQFRDLNPDINAFQRKFVNEVRRCEEMDRKLRFLEKEIKKDGIPILDTGDSPDAPAPREMIDLESTFEKLENEMKEVNANTEALKRNFLDLTELKQILKNAQTFFAEAMTDQALSEDASVLLSEEKTAATSGQPQRLGFVAGVILRERVPAFERLLWRACRGNVFLKLAEVDGPLEDPVTGDQVNKSVFIIFFQGDQLKARVIKICEGFRATLYPCPETQVERKEMSAGVMARIEDLNTVLSQTQDHRTRVLITAAKNIKVWFIKVRKIKSIYHTLNMLNIDVTQKCLISECWCPVKDLEKIQMALTRGTERSGSSVPSILNRMETSQQPPTYNCTNKFTEVFQSVVDSYGVSTYLEINPAPFTIISFPFLFSLMFGDAGHGLVMLMVALWMVLFEKRLMKQKTDNEIWNIFFGGRYIILLMGAFSVYSGLMYNDCLSKSINIFGSKWKPGPDKYDTEFLHKNPHSTLDPTNNTDYTGYPYPFGMDPIWMVASNKITWLNSYKMKISVVFGVGQMIFGLILSLQNHRFRKDSLSIICEFLPQMIFILCIFGYLIILILYKFINIDASQAACAPSLLIGLINMFLMNYPEEPCSAKEFYSGQKGFQIFLLLVAVACVPWLLIAKPVMLKRRNDAKNNKGNKLPFEHKLEDGLDVNATKDHEEEFNMGEIIVHQCIHTIEYCLGCISHTASYLRLWALSLAHAELSEVLWNMIFRVALKMSGWPGTVATFLLFAPWAFLTITILLLMEGLSAFLHTLRLHWVEFQSKFYQGDGYLFEPFSFDKIIEIDIKK